MPHEHHDACPDMSPRVFLDDGAEPCLEDAASLLGPAILPGCSGIYEVDWNSLLAKAVSEGGAHKLSPLVGDHQDWWPIVRNPGLHEGDM